MKKFFSTTLLLLFICQLIQAQILTQTVRGTITDIDSKMPLVGVHVLIPGTEPLLGTITDTEGRFKITKVPVGHIALQLLYVSYENVILPDIEVNSGKEVVLDLNMREIAVDLEEVLIRSNTEKGAASNDMALVSARSISLNETERYTGSFNDPSRIMSNYAGVASTPDGSSDIIVRGNSPKYQQWRLEGIEIPTPYHFNDQNTIGNSGLTALNNNLLASSNFYTGAFSAEYGNVLSSVFDLRLRPGNNEKFESTFGFGLLGADVTVEGPFSKDYSGSYLFNYRYSTTAMISDLGLVDIGGEPKFQDMAFKILLPSKKLGTFSLFGLGGFSQFSLTEVTPTDYQTPTNTTLPDGISEDFNKKAYLLNLGLNHSLPLGANSFLETSLAYSGNGVDDQVFEINRQEIMDQDGNIIQDSLIEPNLNFKNQLSTHSYLGSVSFHSKLNARHKIQLGTRYSLTQYDYQQKQINQSGELFPVMDFNKPVGILRNFASWKYRVNNRLTMVAGLHHLQVGLNQKQSLEPRFSISQQISPSASIYGGYGKHSTMERIHHYFAQTEKTNGSVFQPNRDLDLLKAHHFVLGYKNHFSQNLMFTVEAYYQDLYNLPVENNDTSYFATINEGVNYRYLDLVNAGTGKNYGLELTLERFFDGNYYFLINGSLFNSTYTALDGIERNTEFNGNYLINMLAGKEFTRLGKKKNRSIALNARFYAGGGRRIVALLRNEAGQLAVDSENNQFWDHQSAYDDKLDDIYMLTLSASYKIHRPKATHEIFIDLNNVTNAQGRLSEYYDASEPGGIGYTRQFAFFPNLMYRVYF